MAAATIFLIAATSWFTGCASQSPRAGQARTATEVKSPLVGKTWLLAGYTFQGQFIPLEPGHGSSAKLAFRGDGTLSGYTGANVFSGTWRTGKPGSAGIRGFSARVSVITNKASQNEVAARFEADILREFAASRAVKIEKDSIRLLDDRGGILLRFIATTATDLY